MGDCVEHDEHRVDRSTGARRDRHLSRCEAEAAHGHAAHADRQLRHVEPSRVVAVCEDHVVPHAYFCARDRVPGRVAHEPDQGTRSLSAGR